jgi:hypothetical protein
VSKPIPAYLRLHVEDGEPEAPPALARSSESIAAVQRAFQEATGWPLELSDLDGANPLPTLADDSAIRDLGDAIAGLTRELQTTRRVLRQREAELAVGVPLVSHHDEDAHLAARLQAILQGGVEAVDASAGALYLLDEATSHLKLRAAWGLAADRFLEPARPLRGAVADLEALTGHAVAIEDVRLLPHWRVPENFASAACVPVSSPTTPLGTLWVFSHEVRDYSQRQTNLLEIVAGRIASDLEREILLVDAVQTRALRDDWQQMQRARHEPLPARPLESRAWELTALCGAPGPETPSGFCDWHERSDGAIAFAVARAEGTRLTGVMTAELLRGAAQVCLAEQTPADLAQRASEVLWTTSTGDRFAHLAAGLLDPHQGRLELCTAGRIDSMLVRPDSGKVVALSTESNLLGSDPDYKFPAKTYPLAAGDILVLTQDARERAKLPAAQTVIDIARQNRSAPIQRLTEALQQACGPATILVARRRPSGAG